MKRIVSFVIVLCVVLALGACGKSAVTTDGSTSMEKVITALIGPSGCGDPGRGQGQIEKQCSRSVGRATAKALYRACAGGRAGGAAYG